MLKGRSLKSCAALVVFCFSLVVACISPAWASTTGTPEYDDAHGMTLYVSPYNTDPLRAGRSFTLPISDQQGLGVLAAGVNDNYGYAFRSLEFQPFDYDVSVVLAFTVIPAYGGTVSGTLDYNLYDNVVGTSDYFRSGDAASSPFNYSLTATWLNNGYLTSEFFAPYATISYLLPAGTNGIRFNGLVWPSISVPSKDALFACVTGYVVHSGDQSVVQQVNSILDEVKKANGNLTSAISVLNQILVECKNIHADTLNIISILGLCRDQLIYLNGKVDNIYKLLKDSLATESGVVDKKSEELADQIMQRVDSEQYWNDKNTENFNALDMGNWTFGDGIVGALPTVGNLFKSLWDSIGDVTLIFVFPLMLGIALVIVGRVSRTAGKGAKKGGGEDG